MSNRYTISSLRDDVERINHNLRTLGIHREYEVTNDGPNTIVLLNHGKTSITSYGTSVYDAFGYRAYGTPRDCLNAIYYDIAQSLLWDRWERNIEDGGHDVFEELVTSRGDL